MDTNRIRRSLVRWIEGRRTIGPVEWRMVATNPIDRVCGVGLLILSVVWFALTGRTVRMPGRMS